MNKIGRYIIITLTNTTINLNFKKLKEAKNKFKIVQRRANVNSNFKKTKIKIIICSNLIN